MEKQRYIRENLRSYTGPNPFLEFLLVKWRANILYSQSAEGEEEEEEQCISSDSEETPDSPLICVLGCPDCDMY